MSESKRTVIIGGGVIGACTAYFLARAGVEVVLIEQGEIAEKASQGNAGQMAIGHPPIPRPGLTWQAIKWMLDPASPLHLSPKAGWSMIPWLLRFRKACSEKQLNRSMQTLAQLGRLTRPLFDEIIDAEQIECDYQPSGILDVYRTRRGMEQGKHGAELLHRFGFDVQEFAADELLAREPAFKPGVAGAFLNKESTSLDPALFVRGVAHGAARLGASLQTQCSAQSIITENGAVRGVATSSHGVIDADRVVLTAGIWSTPLAAAVGVRIPMQAGKGYHIDIEQDEPRLSTPCVLGERFVACTPIGDRLRLAGTLEFTGVNDAMRKERLDAIVRGANIYVKGISRRTVYSQWCGLRPCAADGLPIIGWAPQTRGLCIATGHAMLGMTLGPITGQLVCELLTDAKSSVDLTPMRVDRL